MIDGSLGAPLSTGSAAVTIALASIAGWILFVGTLWLVYRAFVVPRSDETVRMARLQVIGHATSVIWLGAGVAFAASVYLSPPSGVVATGAVLVALSIAGSMLSSANAVALDRTNLLERAGADDPRDAIRPALFWGTGCYGGLGVVAIVLSTATAAAPALVFVAVVGYYVADPWLSEHLADTAAVPRDCANRLEALAADANCPDVRFRLVDSTLPNAEATGLVPGYRTVFLTEPAVETLDPAELDAVVAHELAHYRKGHLPVQASVSAVAWSGLLVAVLHSWLALLLVAVGFGVLGVVRTRHEYAADAGGASLTSPTAMAAALERLTDVGSLPRETGRFLSFLNEHPSTSERVARLRGGDG